MYVCVQDIHEGADMKWLPSAEKNRKCEKCSKRVSKFQFNTQYYKWYRDFWNSFTFYSSVHIAQHLCLAFIKVLADNVLKPINHHVNKVCNVLTAIIHRQLQAFSCSL